MITFCFTIKGKRSDKLIRGQARRNKFIIGAASQG